MAVHVRCPAIIAVPPPIVQRDSPSQVKVTPLSATYAGSLASHWMSSNSKSKALVRPARVNTHNACRFMFWSSVALVIFRIKAFAVTVCEQWRIGLGVYVACCWRRWFESWTISFHLPSIVVPQWRQNGRDCFGCKYLMLGGRELWYCPPCVWLRYIDKDHASTPDAESLDLFVKLSLSFWCTH